MGLLPILSVIQTVTIDTILNFDDGNTRHRLKIFSCKQTFDVEIVSNLEILLRSQKLSLYKFVLFHIKNRYTNTRF